MEVEQDVSVFLVQIKLGKSYFHSHCGCPLRLKKEKESALRSHAVIGFPKRSSESRASLLGYANGMGCLHLGLLLQLGFVCLELFLSGFSLFCSLLGKVLSGDEELGFIPMTRSMERADNT